MAGRAPSAASMVKALRAVEYGSPAPPPPPPPGGERLKLPRDVWHPALRDGKTIVALRSELGMMCFPVACGDAGIEAVRRVAEAIAPAKRPEWTWQAYPPTMYE